jgi:uncharacterized protein (DUF433 family)
METIQNIELISIDPDVRSGRPCVAGTGITVADIVIAKVIHMLSPDEIASDFDLTLGQVYAALAYYYENKEAIDTSIKERRQLAARMKEGRVGSRHKPLFG